jgi:hypothetical protein
MNHRVSNLRKVSFAACVGVAASVLFACSSDDSSSTLPPDAGSDSASTGSSTTSHSSSTSSAIVDAAADSTATVHDAALDSTALDSASADSTVDGNTAADAAHDATADVTAEAEAASPPPTPPALCDQFDAIYGDIVADAGTANAENQRGMEWAPDLANEYANEVHADCRFGRLTTLLNSTDASNWANSLLAYVQEIVGCPVLAEADGGALPYAIVPPTPASVASHSWSSADLAALHEIMINSMNVTLTTDINTEPSLTSGQAAAITAVLQYGSAQVLSFQSSTYTYDSCSDGGTDGGDGG